MNRKYFSKWKACSHYRIVVYLTGLNVINSFPCRAIKELARKDL